MHCEEMGVMRNCRKSKEAQLLKVRYWGLDLEESHALASRLVGREYSTHPSQRNPNLKGDYLRLRWRRIRALKHFVAIGGRVNPAALKWKLPSRKDWPGVNRMVPPLWVYKKLESGGWKRNPNPEYPVHNKSLNQIGAKSAPSG